MKKILSLALTLMLIFSCFAFTSCGKEPTAYELILSAVEKSSALSDIEMEQSLNIKMDMMGMSMDVPITMTLKGKSIDSENALYYSSATTSMMGMTVDSVVYIEGKDVYTVTMGEGFKLSLDSLEGEYDIAKDLTSVFFCPSESVFEGVEVVKNEDGTRSVSFDMTQEEYVNAYRAYYDSMISDVGAGPDDAKLSDIKVTITVNKEGYISAFKMSCNVQATVTELGMDTDVNAAISTDIRFVNIGGKVTITPPEGYQSFTALGGDEK